MIKTLHVADYKVLKINSNSLSCSETLIGSITMTVFSKFPNYASLHLVGLNSPDVFISTLRPKQYPMIPFLPHDSSLQMAPRVQRAFLHNQHRT